MGTVPHRPLGHPEMQLASLFVVRFHSLITCSPPTGAISAYANRRPKDSDAAASAHQGHLRSYQWCPAAPGCPLMASWGCQHRDISGHFSKRPDPMMGEQHLGTTGWALWGCSLLLDCGHFQTSQWTQIHPCGSTERWKILNSRVVFYTLISTCYMVPKSKL